MTPYEEKLAALGITNRGQLASGFIQIGVEQFHESELINPRALRSDFIRPVAEDLTRLNPPTTAVFRKAQPRKHETHKNKKGGLPLDEQRHLQGLH